MCICGFRVSAYATVCIWKLKDPCWGQFGFLTVGSGDCTQDDHHTWQQTTSPINPCCCPIANLLHFILLFFNQKLRKAMKILKFFSYFIPKIHMSLSFCFRYFSIVLFGIKNVESHHNSNLAFTHVIIFLLSLDGFYSVHIYLIFLFILWYSNSFYLFFFGFVCFPIILFHEKSCRTVDRQMYRRCTVIS